MNHKQERNHVSVSSNVKEPQHFKGNEATEHQSKPNEEQNHREQMNLVEHKR